MPRKSSPPHSRNLPVELREDWPLPWPLAWHPRIEKPSQSPDPAQFTTPRCGGLLGRTQGGLWTSPSFPVDKTLQPAVSVWSVFHERETMRMSDVTHGWFIEWPPAERTATVTSYSDLELLYKRYPCTQHRSLEKPWQEWAGHFDDDGWLLVHEERQWPALDFAAMAADGIDALHLTENGRLETMSTIPGTASWSCETVLWLTASWTVMHRFALAKWPL